MPLISVIIPVYNTAKYLRRCLDSVLAQSFENFELILVDDCSRDESGAICEEYAAKDHRISIIHHQGNQGVSAARNHGIDTAQGDYISFIDSDDWVETNYLKDFTYNLTTTANPELLTQDVTQINEKGETVYYGGRTSLSFSVAKMFSRSLIEEQQLRFPVGIKTAEDTLFMIDYMNCVDRILYIPQCNYHYVTNEDGACVRHKSNPWTVIVGLKKELELLQRGNFRNDEVRDYTMYRTCINYFHFVESLYQSNTSHTERVLLLKEIFHLATLAYQLYPIRYKTDRIAIQLFKLHQVSIGDYINAIANYIRKRNK